MIPQFEQHKMEVQMLCRHGDPLAEASLMLPVMGIENDNHPEIHSTIWKCPVCEHDICLIIDIDP